jgi:hypothetical protein
MTPEDDFGEWVGGTAQVKAAIATGSPKLLGWCFRDLGS